MFTLQVDEDARPVPGADHSVTSSSTRAELDTSIPWTADSLKTHQVWSCFRLFSAPAVELEYQRWAHQGDYLVMAVGCVILATQLLVNGAINVDAFTIAIGSLSFATGVIETFACALGNYHSIPSDVSRRYRHVFIQRVHWLLFSCLTFGVRPLVYTCFVGQPKFWIRSEVCTRYFLSSQVFCMFGIALIRDPRWCLAELAVAIFSQFLAFAASAPPSIDDFAFRFVATLVFAALCAAGNIANDRASRKHFVTVALVMAAHHEAAAQRADFGAMLRVALPERLLERLAATPTTALWDASKNALVAITEVANMRTQTLRSAIQQLHHLFTLFDDNTSQYNVDRATVYGDAYVVTSGMIAGSTEDLLGVCRFVKWQHQLRTARNTALTLDLRSIIVRGEASGGLSEEGSLQYAVHGEAVTRAMKLLPQVPDRWCWMDCDCASRVPKDVEFFLGPPVCDGACVPLGFASQKDDFWSSTGYSLRQQVELEEDAGAQLHQRLGFLSLPAPPAKGVSKLLHVSGVIEDEEKEQAFQIAAASEVVHRAPYAFAALCFLATGMLIIIMSERIVDPATWESSGPGSNPVGDGNNVATFLLLSVASIVSFWLGVAVLVTRCCAFSMSSSTHRDGKLRVHRKGHAEAGAADALHSSSSARHFVTADGIIEMRPESHRHESVIASRMLPTRSPSGNAGGLNPLDTLPRHHHHQHDVTLPAHEDSLELTAIPKLSHLDAVQRHQYVRAKKTQDDDKRDDAVLWHVPLSKPLLCSPWRITAVWFTLVALVVASLFPTQRSVMTNGSAFVALALGVLTVMYILRQWRWALAGLVTSIVIVAPQLGATVYHLGTGSGPLSGNALCCLLIFLAAWAGPHRARVIFLSAEQACAGLEAIVTNTANLTAAASRRMPTHVAKRALKALRHATVNPVVYDVSTVPTLDVTDNYPDFAALHVYARWRVVDPFTSNTSSTTTLRCAEAKRSTGSSVISRDRKAKRVATHDATAPQIDRTDILGMVESLMRGLTEGSLAFIQALGDSFTIGGPFAPQGDMGVANAATCIVALLEKLVEAAPEVEFVAAAALEEAAGAILGVHSLRYRVFGVSMIHSKALMDAAEAQTVHNGSEGVVLFATRRFRAATRNDVPRKGTWLQPRPWRVRDIGLTQVHTYTSIQAHLPPPSRDETEGSSPKFAMPPDF